MASSERQPSRAAKPGPAEKETTPAKDTAAFPGAGSNAGGEAGWFSYATHHWASPLVHYGHKNLLRPADIFTLPQPIDPEVGRGQTEDGQREERRSARRVLTSRCCALTCRSRCAALRSTGRMSSTSAARCATRSARPQTETGREEARSERLSCTSLLPRAHVFGLPFFAWPWRALFRQGAEGGAAQQGRCTAEGARAAAAPTARRSFPVTSGHLRRLTPLPPPPLRPPHPILCVCHPSGLCRTRPA